MLFAQKGRVGTAERARRVILHLWRRLTREEAPVLAAGIAFYAFLALLPGLLSIFVLYGLLADQDDVHRQLAFLIRILPPDAAAFLGDEMKRLAARSKEALGMGALVSLVVAVWSTSHAIRGVISVLGPSSASAVSFGRVRRKLLAFGLAAGALVVAVVAIAAIVAIPGLMMRFGLSRVSALVVGASRWPALAAIVFGWLALLYRYGPAKGPVPWPRVVWGSVAATGVWLVGSAAFSFYLARFGRRDPIYDSVAGVIALLAWFLLGAYSVLLGAELNVALEAETDGDL
jgi:membrane protein